MGHANLVVFFKPCRPLPLFAYCTHAVQLGLLSTANTLCFIVFVVLCLCIISLVVFVSFVLFVF